MNMRSMCSTSEKSVNPTRQNPPLIRKCSMLLGKSQQEYDYHYPELKPSCAEMCLPRSQSPFPEALKSSLNSCEPKPSESSTRISLSKSTPIPQSVGINKLLMFLLGFCLPIGGSLCPQNDQCMPIMVCLPNQPQLPQEDKCKKKEEELKPIGLITRNKEADFIGGRFISGCTCGRKNGLQGDCPRISCRNNPGCSMNPPRCWPQFKEPVKPELPPDQKMYCVPIQLVYYDPSNC